MLHGAHGGVDAVLPARAGRRQVLQLLHALLPGGPAPGFAAPPGATELHRLLHTAQGVLRRRCAVFVVSDAVGSYFPEFNRSALEMIKAQGGIFGWVAASTAVINAIA